VGRRPCCREAQDQHHQATVTDLSCVSIMPFHHSFQRRRLGRDHPGPRCPPNHRCSLTLELIRRSATADAAFCERPPPASQPTAPPLGSHASPQLPASGEPTGQRPLRPAEIAVPLLDRFPSSIAEQIGIGIFQAGRSVLVERGFRSPIGLVAFGFGHLRHLLFPRPVPLVMASFQRRRATRATSCTLSLG